MKKHEKLAQEGQIHHLRRQRRDLLCLWLESKVGHLLGCTWSLVPLPKMSVRLLVSTPWYWAVQIPALCHVGGCPAPWHVYDLHSWEQGFKTACSMLLIIDFSLHVTSCPINSCPRLLPSSCHTCILPTQFNNFPDLFRNA